MPWAYLKSESVFPEPRRAVLNKMQPASRYACPTSRRTLVQSATTRHGTEDLADVERVLAGDAAAFEGIVQRWQGPLVNMAWRYCRDRSRAEEMAQEAFVRAWRNLAQWRREASFSTWLFALAANVFRNELKKIPTLNRPIEDAAEPARPAAQINALEERSRQEAVRRAVLSLPLNYREPVLLFYFHEMDVGAAARTMGLPDGTVKARLSRAREMLRKRFPHLLKEYGASKET